MTSVLIVEDNEMNRDMLRRRLERKGYVVVLAVDGPAGIAAAREHLPDVILMDVALGDSMDGWEATRAIKGDGATAAIPVIALTAHALESDRQASIQAGCSDFETKPIDLQRLIEKIELHRR
ncbi:MAG: response regulator [Sphingomonadales bacterium]|nr:response regulator [Sphingomonadales bacterium]